MLENRRGIVCAPSHRPSWRISGSLSCSMSSRLARDSNSLRREGNAHEPDCLYCRCRRHHHRSPVVLRIAVEKRTRSAGCASARVYMVGCVFQSREPAYSNRLMANVRHGLHHNSRNSYRCRECVRRNQHLRSADSHLWETTWRRDLRDFVAG
jgi:hypothetical protein